MPDLIKALLLIAVLIILIIVPNIKVLRQNEVMIIERLGRFHRIIDVPGFHFLIPFIERNIELVNLDKTHVSVNIHYEINHESKLIALSYDMTIIDPKAFVYSDFDSRQVIHDYISESLSLGLDQEEIIRESIKHAHTFGFDIEEMYLK